jgi:hypothetical protein
MAVAVAVAGCSGENPSDPGPLPAQFGSLVVTISGLPTAASASVTVTGPGTFSRVVTATTTLSTLAAGTYTIAVADVTHDGAIYGGSPVGQSISVSAGATATASSIGYVLASGSLSVTFSGLPQSTPAPIVISGPDGYSRTISEPANLSALKPGAYSIEAREVQLTNGRYAGSPATQQVDVLASLTAAQAHVNYAIASGSMALNIAGLPTGAPGAVTITGPGSYSASFTSSATIDNLTPGTYTVAATNVTSGSLFVPTPAGQQVVITASAEAVVVNVSYVSTGTSLNVQILGLPANMSGSVTIAGPNGYAQSLIASQLLIGVPAGSYTITAAAVGATCTTFAPLPPTQTVSVGAGQTASASVTYSSGVGGLNLCIDGAYVTQSVQAYDNSVPLVAGRNGLLRVFVRASGPNSALPAVRARFYSGATLVNTVMIPAPVASVPTSVDEATLSSSWNVQVSGASLQPGLRILLDVDPANAVAEGNETDNMLPANGIPATMDVRTVSALSVRLVPVIQAARGDTARVSESNKANFILPMQKMFPVATIDADVRAPYTYNGAELTSGGTNWTGLLSEINAVRMAEATGRVYYGVVRVGYTSGVAGLGYIGVPAAIGWDYQPSGTEVMAHELGHNFGRLHAPCGSPAAVDDFFPYAGGTIGVFGYDIFSGLVKLPVVRDLMSYCDPTWISDYTYKAILNFRAANPMTVNARISTAAVRRGLLVWGRIEQGRLVLEPGFEVDAPAALPPRGGPNRLEGFGPSGEVLFSLAFAGDRVADSPDPNDETFAFVIPMSQLRGVDLDRLRFSALGRQVEQRRTGGGAIPSAQRTAPGRVRVTWNASAARAAMVRDARTGEVLSFGRGGVVDLPTASDDLEVTLSDGVRSVRSRIRPR